MKLLVTVISLLAAGVVSAASPVWAVQTLGNVRKAAKLAQMARRTSQIVRLGKCKNALPESEIRKLAGIAAEKGGLDKVGALLGAAKIPAKYGREAGHLVLQDAYLRIAVTNGKISRATAASVLKNLHGTEGLTALLRKINSVNPAQTKGHLRELEIALKAKERGFQTVSFGQKFADGLKKADTDLDVLLRRGRVNFAIESKAYSGNVSSIVVKEDAQSLAAFCGQVKKTVPVFCFEKEPSTTIKAYLKNHNVKCLWGSPEEISSKIDLLSTLY